VPCTARAIFFIAGAEESEQWQNVKTGQTAASGKPGTTETGERGERGERGEKGEKGERGGRIGWVQSWPYTRASTANTFSC
jgi:hypothetical protein